MDRRSFLTSMAALAVSTGFVDRALAQAAGTPAPTPPANPSQAALTAFMDRVFADVMRTSPEFATMLGLDTGPNAALRSQLSDFSQTSRDEALARARSYETDFARIDRNALSESAKLHYDAMHFLGESSMEALAGFNYGGGGFNPYVITQQDGAYFSVPDFLDQHHQVRNAADADTYLARLTAFGTALDQNSEKFRRDAGLGVAPPDFILDTTLTQVRALRNQPAAQTTLVASFARKLTAANIAGDHAARAERIVTDRVFPALDRQIALLTETRARASSDAGVWRLPQGAQLYAGAVKSSTTTSMTPQEIHQMGLDQVAEYSRRINTILDRLGKPAGPVGQRLTALNQDPTQLYPNTDEGRTQLIASLNEQMAHLATLLPRSFATLPQAQVRIVRVPEAIQDGAPNGYYQPAPFDGSRPALYFINLKNTHDWPKYSLPSLTYHEASPGHHLQISLSQEARDLPMLLKLSPFTAYTEGWGLYAEQLAAEMGVYADNPLGEVGYLQSFLFRACRLVVDTGIHAQRWSRQRATDYMVETTGFTRARVQREIDRYCAWPGQACSYKVGHASWVRIREASRAALGERFDIRQFHQILLKGALPLTVLEQEVQRWTAAQRT